MTRTPLILLVDDEPLVTRLHGRAVAALGYRYESALSVDAAMEIITQEPPSLLVTDLNMPGEDGIEFTARIKRFRADFPVLLMTGDDNVDILIRGLKAGVDDFLYKGMPFDALAQVLRFWADGPLKGLPRYIRKSVLNYFDLAWPLGPPIRQLRGDISAVEERAEAVFRDLVYRTADGFGRSPTDQMRLLGTLEGILTTLTRSTPLAKLRIPGIMAAVMATCDLEGLQPGLRAQFGRLDELFREPTFIHARETLVMAA